MRQSETRRVVAGVLLIAAVVALGAFVFLLGNVRALLEHRYELIVIFDKAPRLRVGSPVWIGGHEIGRVTAIGLLPVRADSSARVAAHVEIPRKYQPLVRSDSRGRLTSARMIGEPVVDISPGTRNARVLVAGDTVYSVPGIDLLGAFQIWRGFQSAIDSLVKVSRVLQPRIVQRKPQLMRLAARIQDAKAEFTRVTDLLRNSSLAELSAGGQVQTALSDLGETAKQLGPALRAASQRYNDPAFRSALARMGAHADSLSLQLNALKEQLGNGSLARFAQDSAIQFTVLRTQIELDSLMAETKRNPLRFWLGNRK